MKRPSPSSAGGAASPRRTSGNVSSPSPSRSVASSKEGGVESACGDAAGHADRQRDGAEDDDGIDDDGSDHDRDIDEGNSDAAPPQHDPDPDSDPERDDDDRDLDGISRGSCSTELAGNTGHRDVCDGENDDGLSLSSRDHDKDDDHDGDHDGAHGDSADSSPKCYEAKYEEGATELFQLIESQKWEEALRLLEEEPDEAKIWVVSSGTENTVFSWSVWRRLPIHEACRRQPPPILIYALLSAHPSSPSLESQFGELPLHAAVRCGACAEVVHALLASRPSAALARDNSGCTPLDILNGTGKMMDHDAVVAALTRTMGYLDEVEREREIEAKGKEREYRKSKEKRRRECERIVEKKNREIKLLQREIEQEKLATSNLAAKVIQTEKVVELKSTLERRHQDKIKRMEDEIQTLKSTNASRKAKIRELEEIIRGDRKKIAELNGRVTLLEGEFTSLCGEEDMFVDKRVVRAEEDLKALMKGQMLLIREAEKKKDLLRARLVKLGVNLPKKRIPKEDADEEDGGDGNDGDEHGREDVDDRTTRRRHHQDGDGTKKKTKAPAKPNKPREAIDEPTDEEIAEKALAAAMAHLATAEGDDCF